MARPPRRLVMNILWNFWNSFKPRHLNAELVGVDKLGNQYFEAKQTANSIHRKPSRYYLPHSGEEDFDQKLPAEWEAWLRGRRKLPPTLEEIAKNDGIAAQKKENAMMLEAERSKTKAVGLPKDRTGPESFPNYGNEYEYRPGHKIEQ